MKNSEYWYRMASLIEDTGKPDISKIPVEQYGSVAYELLQQGVTFYFACNSEKAELYLKEGLKLLGKKMGYYTEASDLLWNITAVSIVADKIPHIKIAERDEEILRKDVDETVLKYGLEDIYETYKAYVNPKPERFFTEHASFFEKSSPDVHPYRTVAALLNEYARRLIIYRLPKKAFSAADAAKMLCYTASDRVLDTIAQEDPSWKPVVHNPLLIKGLTKIARNEFNKLKNTAAGALPEFFAQANMLKVISAKLSGNNTLLRDSVRDLKNKKSVYGEHLLKDRGPDTPVDTFYNLLFGGSLSEDIPGSVQSQTIMTIFKAVNFAVEHFSSGYRRKPFEIIEEYFNSRINPPDKKGSALGLLEELEWALVRIKLEESKLKKPAQMPVKEMLFEYLS